MAKVQKILAKPISYGETRPLSSITAIVIHNTGNRGDSASGNGNYFKNTNTRSAGAHFFVDQQGNIVLSIPIEKIAWAVGGERWSNYKETDGAKYFGVYNNSNTISIELCDVVDKDPSDAMINSIRQVIADIRKKCPNAKKIIRHFDVTGKDCPRRAVDSKVWKSWLDRIEGKEFVKEYGKPQDPETFISIIKFFLRTEPKSGKEYWVKYKDLSDTLKTKCKNVEGYAQFKKGKTFTRVRSYTDHNGDTWKQMKSGLWCPGKVNGVQKVKVKD